MEDIKDNKFGLRIINMEFSTDLPIVRPDRNKDWVTWGEKNTYPQHLLNLFHNKSITHKQIINRKVKMVAGNGIEMPTNPSKQFTQFLANQFGDMTIEELAIKMAFDLIIFNGISLNPHWNIDNSGITRLCYVPFERVRQDKYNNIQRNDGLPNYVWLSENWFDFRKEENKPCKYVKFDQKWKNDKSQIYYFMGIDQGVKWYPDVEYSPALNYIDADWEIGNYHNNAIKNGFHAGFMLNFATGIPTEEEMDRAYEDIAIKFTGSNNANKFLLGWSNGQEGAPQLLPIPMNTSDTKYMELNALIRDKILESHEAVNPLLFGIPVPGTLGGRTELLESLSMYQSTYIDGKQKVIEDILNKFAKLYGVDTEKEPIKLKKYHINIPEIEGKPVLSITDIISLISSINTNQISLNSALNVLEVVYGVDPEKARKMLKAPMITPPINGEQKSITK